MLASKENNKALEILNNKIKKKLNNRGILASYLISPLSKFTNPENTSQIKSGKNHNSKRVNDLLIHNTIQFTLYNNWLPIRHTAKNFELEGDLLKMITNKIYNVDLASLSDKKLMYDFAKEMYFDVKFPSNKSTGDRTLKSLPESSTIMASGKSTKVLPGNPNELCDRLGLLLQEKQTGTNSDINNGEFIAISDKLLE